MVNVLSVDLNTGDIIIFDETTPVEKQPFAMLASARHADPEMEVYR